jgi:ABC-2 type transport system permease protein
MNGAPARPPATEERLPSRRPGIWAPFYSLYSREMHRFLKVVFQTVFSPLISSTLYLLIFGVSLGGSISLKGGESYLAFLIPGLVMMSALNNAFQNSSSSIVSGKFSGDLEDWRVVPLSDQQIIWAVSLAGLTRGLLVGFVTFVVGAAFLFVIEGHMAPFAHPLALIFFLAVGGLSFAKLGISVAFWARSFDQVSAVGAFLLLPLIYLGGVFFSLRNLHPFWQAISRFNPVLYFINGVRYGMLGASDVDIGVAVAVSLGSLLLFHVLGLRALRGGNYARW